MDLAYLLISSLCKPLGAEAPKKGMNDQGVKQRGGASGKSQISD